MKRIFLLLFFCSSLFGKETVDLLFYLHDAGETYAMIPVIQELKEEGLTFKIVADGVAEKLLSKQFDLAPFSELEEVEPRVVITGVSYTPQGEFLDRFKKKKAFTVAYWDNFNRTGTIPYFQTAEEVTHHADVVFVPTLSMVDTFAPIGIAVGQPSLETWQEAIRRMEPIALRQKLGICVCKNILLFIGGYGKEYEESVKLFAESIWLAKTSPHLLVLVQPHPKAPEGDFETSILDNANIHHRILRGEVTTQEAVALSNLVACHQSTVAFQALAAGKPVIHFVPVAQSFTSVLLEKGLAQKVVFPSDFPSAYRNALRATKECDLFEIIGAPRNSAKLCVETIHEFLQ